MEDREKKIKSKISQIDIYLEDKNGVSSVFLLTKEIWGDEQKKNEKSKCYNK